VVSQPRHVNHSVDMVKTTQTKKKKQKSVSKIERMRFLFNPNPLPGKKSRRDCQFTEWQISNCSKDIATNKQIEKISSFLLFIECWRLRFHRWLRQLDCRIHFRTEMVFEAPGEKVRNRHHWSRGAGGERRLVASRPACGNSMARRLRSSILSNCISRRNRATFCRLGRQYASPFDYTDRRLCHVPN